MKQIIPTMLVELGIPLRERVASLLHETAYQVIARIPVASQILEVQRPALAILGLSGDDALISIQKTRRALPDCKIVGIAELADQRNVGEFISHGADGVVVNLRSREVLLKALDLALSGQRFVIIGRDHSLSQVLNQP